jgi:hypothetical protein
VIMLVLDWMCAFLYTEAFLQALRILLLKEKDHSSSTVIMGTKTTGSEGSLQRMDMDLVF